MELSCLSLRPLLSSSLMQTSQFLLQSNCCCVFRSTNIKAFIRLNHFCAVLIVERDWSNWRLFVPKGLGLSQPDGIDGCGLYHDLDVSAMWMQHRVLKSKMNPGKSYSPSIISHSGKPVKIRSRGRVNLGFSTVMCERENNCQVFCAACVYCVFLSALDVT